MRGRIWRLKGSWSGSRAISRFLFQEEKHPHSDASNNQDTLSSQKMTTPRPSPVGYPTYIRTSKHCAISAAILQKVTGCPHTSRRTSVDFLGVRTLETASFSADCTAVLTLAHRWVEQTSIVAGDSDPIHQENDEQKGGPQNVGASCMCVDGAPKHVRGFVPGERLEFLIDEGCLH